MTQAGSIAGLVEAAEPRDPRPVGGLVERLHGEGRLRGARLGSRPAAPVDLGWVEIRGVTDDSRCAGNGKLFVAIPGTHVDGHDFIAAAARAGAAGALVEHPNPDIELPQLVVDRSQRALASAAAWWYGDPSRDLSVVGITGTDGKTTTSFLAVGALEAAGIRTGLVGTVERKIGPARERTAGHVTTPSAPELQAALRAMVANGDEAVVIESTSHGLAAERVGAVAYDVAIVTNVTHEHLEFHGTFEAYREAKLSLFERLASGPRNPAKTHLPRPWPRLAIVNRDDPSAGLFEAVGREAGAHVITYGTDPSSDVHVTRVEEDARRLRIAYATPSGDGRLELRLAGRFNVHNALAVVALGEGLGLDREAVRSGLQSIEGVPGRMERIDQGQPFGVVVDYAHSPASLEKVLGILAPVAAARGGGLIAVFGSAGERDVEKRSMMGRIAAESCRLVVVTDEDPRGEDRDAINEQIAAGAEQAGKRRDADLLVIADRRSAIEAAFERARTGDVVLLAGKGHEQTIIYAEGAIPWDEATVARDVLATLGYVGAAV